MAPRRFPQQAPTTKVHYASGHPTSLDLRKCSLSVLSDPSLPVYGFEKECFTIGAMEDNDIVLDEETVSRYHCHIRQEGDAYILSDVGSTNGTFIDGVRIREAYLAAGSLVTVGKTELRFETAKEQHKVKPMERDRMGGLIGQSLGMREIYEIVEKIAQTSATVVIEGETGTGKEVVAKGIHALSTRACKPFIVFDCGAVPDNLIESELFGHEKGSFTGAIMSRRGLFEMAQGGTILLDELCELGLELQPKLLRVLEQREVRRVGSGKSIHVDVRVIAATNRNLEEELRAGRFREDLFYRLSVVRIFMPPLRDRLEDLPMLVRHFLANEGFNRKLDGSRRVEGLCPEAFEVLMGYDWPGNVRELINVLERACSFAETNQILLKDLPAHLLRGGPSAALRAHATAVSEIVPEPGLSASLPQQAMTRELPDKGLRAKRAAAQPPLHPPAVSPSRVEHKAFKEAKEEWIGLFEQVYLVHLLRKNRMNISHAARDADIDRKYFRKLMRKYDISVKDLDEQY